MSSDDSSLMKSMKEESAHDIAEVPNSFSFAAAASQLDLLREDDGSVNATTARKVRSEKRGPGRRPGSRNKRNQDIAKWFISQYGHPLAALGEIINTPPNKIYDMMVVAQGGEQKNKRITGRDALEFWRGAVMDALPYVEGKQPLSIALTGRADQVLFIPGLNAPTGFSSEQLSIAADSFGIEAIEAAGIRLPTGELIGSPDEMPVYDGEDEDGSPS